jgi:hypothetical protein
MAFALPALALLGCGVTADESTATSELSNPVTRRDAASLIIPFAGFNSAAPTFSTFQDVFLSDPQFGAIEAMWRQGLTSGCGNVNHSFTYCPDDPATRGAMAVFLQRAFVIPFSTVPVPFPDVVPGRLDYLYIQALSAAGLAEPCPGQPGLYCPDAPVTASDLFAILLRFSGRTRPAAQPINVTAGTFGGNDFRVPRGNATVSLMLACNGLFSCDYTVLTSVLGDPSPDGSKDFLAEWTCNDPNNAPVHHAWLFPPANNRAVHLSCP